MEYIALKHTHVMFAVLSILLFFTRAFSRLRTGKLAAHKGVFIASHSIDTLLLVSAVVLAVFASLNPVNQPWLMEKIILVVVYIAVGIVSAKAKTKRVQVSTLFIAVCALLAVGYLAGSKSSFIL
ncbi:SirB2 family protein [Pseudoalteromonas sp. MMG013]|uniref:SirB2 family protein n=1 Tax=unclassified Pseudoalteromonas TaxID=194690 RepID=UPI001B3990A6|nr:MULTISPECIES: SirB2 family protein [unclassified Pseudoalteromonas]MBQ4851486.1 SirB2 family protein [Pseudoalteromonas sp. MMG012]MBQ4864528.1 SirB2 family protein [Pseudoalteromonas sp. MMG013]